MFLKAIHLDKNSYLEISDRITANGTKLQVSMRGTRDNEAVTVMSAVLEPGDAALLAQILLEWLGASNKGQ